MHVSRMHRNLYNAEELVKLEGRIPVKKRWTETEISEMANQEARLLAGDVPYNINQELESYYLGEPLRV